ncbi:probable small nuclear ribonucleoprotein E [Nilaparvata lugens]|uniref:probable small nuclear ribonucleoprotein E n=1 Tax=Nilaparvata lugens TaxID=108931 RepID=UPI000B9853C1|nr:probable small nuclear ribonucleoprotein E [Nilaparvata lugens]
MAYKQQKTISRMMVQPINLIFRFLQNKSRCEVWLYENQYLRIEGVIIGFDEYMNLVMEDAVEYSLKTNVRKSLGRIMLKGDNVTLIQCLEPMPML